MYELFVLSGCFHFVRYRFVGIIPTLGAPIGVCYQLTIFYLGC